MTDTSSKVAIVTGGIGAAIAQRLARDAFTVVVNYAGNAGPAERWWRRSRAPEAARSPRRPARNMDFEATTPARQAEVVAARWMMDRTAVSSKSVCLVWRLTRATVRPRCWVAGRRSDSADRDRIDPLCPFNGFAAMAYFP
jgi:hypothetical protein